MNDWTKRYYDEAYLRRWGLDPRDEKVQKNAGFILELLGIAKGDRLLDVGCGQGRYSLVFAALGIDVTGIDTSEALLAEGRRLAKEMSLSVEWLVGDMREIPFEVAFDGVTSMDAFGFFERDSDNEKALLQMARALKPGGALVLVIVNAARLLENFRELDREERGRLTLEIHRELLGDRRAMREKFHFVEDGRGTKYERYQRLYSVEELSDLLAQAGLVVKGAFGDFAGSAFDTDSSGKIILAARKG